VRWVMGRVWRRSLQLQFARGVLRDEGDTAEDTAEDELLPEPRQLERPGTQSRSRSRSRPQVAGSLAWVL